MKTLDYSDWDKAKIISLVNDCVTVKEISIIMDCTVYAVRKYLKLNNISYKPRIENIEEKTQAEIKKLFDGGKSISEISKQLQLNYYDIRRYIKEFSKNDHRVNNGKGFSYDRANLKRRKISDTDIAIVKKLYCEDKLSLWEIGKKYDTTAATVSNYLKRHGVKVKSKKEASAVVYERYPELRDHFRSLVHKGITGYPVGKRESWIEAYCREWLTMNGYSFQQEFQIDNEGHSYDFCVNDILIEMDGEYWHNTKDQATRDLEFERIANQHGYTVVRITDKEIRDRGDSIMEEKLKGILGERK